MTLFDHGIEKGEHPLLSWSSFGYESTFSSTDASDPLVAYLLLTNEERDSAQIPNAELVEKEKREGAGFSTYRYDEECDIFHDSHRSLLCDLLDFVWSRTASRD